VIHIHKVIQVFVVGVTPDTIHLPLKIKKIPSPKHFPYISLMIITEKYAFNLVLQLESDTIYISSKKLYVKILVMSRPTPRTKGGHPPF